MLTAPLRVSRCGCHAPSWVLVTRLLWDTLYFPNAFAEGIPASGRRRAGKEGLPMEGAVGPRMLGGKSAGLGG